MLSPHRKVPNRQRELRERVYALVGERLTGMICARCGCTLATYADKCEADLAEPCPGFNAVERERAKAEKEVGLRQ